MLVAVVFVTNTKPAPSTAPFERNGATNKISHECFYFYHRYRSRTLSGSRLAYLLAFIVRCMSTWSYIIINVFIIIYYREFSLVPLANTSSTLIFFIVPWCLIGLSTDLILKELRDFRVFFWNVFVRCELKMQDQYRVVPEWCVFYNTYTKHVHKVL